MNIVQAITTCMGKYFTFSGRAKRSEFWWFYLFTMIVGVVYTVVITNLPVTMMPMGGGINAFTFLVVTNLTTVLFLIPTLAAGSRRLHDIGKSSWWLLLLITGVGIILLIVWWATDTKPEGDKYGEAVAETA